MADRRVNIILSAVDKTKRAFSSVTKSVSGLASKLSEVAGQIGLAFGAGSAGALAGIKAMTDELVRLSNVAEKLGITTEELQKLGFVAQSVGLQQEQFEDALQNLVERLSEAKEGTGEAAEALSTLGLDAAQLSNLSLPDQILALADAFKGVANQGDRVRLAIQLAEGEAAGLVRLFALSREEITGLSDRFEELGGVIEGDAFEQARKFNQQIRELDVQIKSFGRSIGTSVLPALQTMVSLINGLSVSDVMAQLGEGSDDASRRVQELRGQIELLNSALRLSTFTGPGFFANRALIVGQLEALNEELRKELAKGSQEREQETVESGKRQIAAQKSISERLNEAIKAGFQAQVKTYEDYLKELENLGRQEIEIRDLIANAGRQFADGAESLALGNELDPGDLFLAYQEGIRQLASGDADAAEQTLKAIAEAMNDLAASGQLDGLTAENLRLNLDALYDDIKQARIEDIQRSAEAADAAKKAAEDEATAIRNQTGAALDEIGEKKREVSQIPLLDVNQVEAEARTVKEIMESQLVPNVTVAVSPESIEQIQLAIIGAMQGFSVPVNVVPSVGPVAGGIVPSTGESGEPSYSDQDLSAAGGHKVQ